MSKKVSVFLLGVAITYHNQNSDITCQSGEKLSYLYLKLTWIFTRLLEWTSLKLSVSSFSYIWKRTMSENSCVIYWLHMTFAEAMFCLFETQGLSFLLSKSSVVILTPLVVFLNVLYLIWLCQTIDSKKIRCVFRLWQGIGSVALSNVPNVIWSAIIVEALKKRVSWERT